MIQGAAQTHRRGRAHECDGHQCIAHTPGWWRPHHGPTSASGPGDGRTRLDGDSAAYRRVIVPGGDEQAQRPRCERRRGWGGE